MQTFMQLLRRLVSAGEAKNVRSRTVLPMIEGLEDRQLLSVTPLFASPLVSRGNGSSSSHSSGGSGSNSSSGSGSNSGSSGSSRSGSSRSGSSSSLSSDDKSWMDSEASSQLFEVKLGKYGQQNASSAVVKAFATRMVRDHSRLDARLHRIATSLHETLPSTLDSKDQSNYDRLTALKGAAFDKAYASFMVEDHHNDVHDAADELKSGSNAQLKRFARVELPILHTHLKLAEQMDTTVNGTRHHRRSTTGTGSGSGSGSNSRSGNSSGSGTGSGSSGSGSNSGSSGSIFSGSGSGSNGTTTTRSVFA